MRTIKRGTAWRDTVDIDIADVWADSWTGADAWTWTVRIDASSFGGTADQVLSPDSVSIDGDTLSVELSMTEAETADLEATGEFIVDFEAEDAGKTYHIIRKTVDVIDRAGAVQ